MENKQLSTPYNELIDRWITGHGGDYLEIGIYNGVFISEIAARHKNSQVFGIDPFIADGWTGEERGSILIEPKKNFIKNSEGLGITFWEKPTQQCLDESLYQKLSNVSAILVDGSHHFDDVMIDIRFISLIQNKNEILVVFDDFHLADVQNAVTAFKNVFNGRIGEEKNEITIYWFILNPTT